MFVQRAVGFSLRTYLVPNNDPLEKGGDATLKFSEKRIAIAYYIINHKNYWNC